MARRWALIIGVNNYHESLGPLKFCVNDAKLMYKTLVSDLCGFGPDHVLLLTDEQPRDSSLHMGTFTLGSEHGSRGPARMTWSWHSSPAMDVISAVVRFCCVPQMLRWILSPSRVFRSSTSTIYWTAARPGRKF